MPTHSRSLSRRSTSGYDVLCCCDLTRYQLCVNIADERHAEQLAAVSRAANPKAWKSLRKQALQDSKQHASKPSRPAWVPEFMSHDQQPEADTVQSDDRTRVAALAEDAVARSNYLLKQNCFQEAVAALSEARMLLETGQQGAKTDQHAADVMEEADRMLMIVLLNLGGAQFRCGNYNAMLDVCADLVETFQGQVRAVHAATDLLCLFLPKHVVEVSISLSLSFYFFSLSFRFW